MQGDEYFTIHVTPQIECAWVSFETNFALDCHSSIISKVLSIFKPGSFTVSLFTSKVRVLGQSTLSVFDTHAWSGIPMPLSVWG